MLRKVVIYHTREHKNVLNFFYKKIGYNLKLLSFLKTNHWIYKKSRHFHISILFKNDEEKNMPCNWTIISIYHNKFEKNIPKFIHMKKKNLAKRTCNPFSNNPIGSLYHVCTHKVHAWGGSWIGALNFCNVFI